MATVFVSLSHTVISYLCTAALKCWSSFLAAVASLRARARLSWWECSVRLHSLWKEKRKKDKREKWCCSKVIYASKGVLQ